MALAPEASIPGGAAVLKLLEIAKIKDAVLANTVKKSSCVQRMISAVIDGQSDASIVEYRITKLPSARGKLDILNIPEKVQPPPPLTFTIGVMKNAPDKKLAARYLDFILSEEGQSFFEQAGFIPAISAKGSEMIARLGVSDA